MGLAVDGAGTLHLLAAAAGGEALSYSMWDGERWSSGEAFALGPDAAQAAGAGLGAAAATLPQGGQLAVALGMMVTGEEEEAVPAVYTLARAIPTVDVPAVPAPLPLPSATPEVAGSEPTPTLAAPTPTPDLMAGPAPSSPPVDPRLLGGGIAAVLIIGALATRPLWGRRR